jgi:Phosphoserine phosphatase
LDYYERSELSWSDLSLEVREAIPARSGAIELFNVCEDKKIPTVILSAGIKDVIELWCEKFRVRPNMILSTKLNFDDRGFICGWDKDSLVHTLNKNETGKKHLRAIQETRPYAILVGDSMDDAAMVDGDENILRIFIDNGHDKENRNNEFYDKVFENFDLIVKNGSLLPIVETIKSIMGQNEKKILIYRQ